MSIADLIRDLFQANRHNNVPSILQFKQIDINGTAKRLGLVAKGHDNGERELPSPEGQALDEVEHSIIAEIEAEGQREYANYLDHQKTYIDRAGSLGIESLLIDIGSAARSAVADFTSRIQNGLDHLYVLRKEVIETERELETFRSRHRISRPARNLEPKALKIGILLVILVIEMIANGLIFAEGSEGGLIEGFGIALLIAAFNVVIGVTAGILALRWLAHWRLSVKLIAFLGMMAYVSSAIAFNLAVAHFRMAVVATDVTQATSIAYKTFVAHPLQIEDLKSWMFFGIGMICSLVALVDGWMMDDPYPGYGQRVRQHREAAELYAEQKKESLDELEAVKNAAEKIIEGRLRDITARRGEYDYIMAKSQALQLALEQHFDHLETSANSLLRIYRSEDRKHRKTPVPERFESNWSYRRPVVSGQAIPESIRMQIEEAVVRAAQDIPQRHAEIIAAYEQAMSQYRRIDQLTARDVPGA